MAKNESITQSRWRYKVIVACGLLLQCWVAVAIFRTSLALPIPVLLLAHGLSALLVGKGLYHLLQDENRLHLCFFVLSCLAIPIYGTVGTLLIFTLMSGHHKTDTFLTEGYTHHIRYNPNITATYRPEDSLKNFIHDRLTVQSYYDILQGQDTQRKKSLIQMLATQWPPQNAHYLNIAVTDPDYEVKILASSVIEQISTKIEAKIDHLKQLLVRNNSSVSLTLNLAQLYLRYIHSQLLDPEYKTYYLSLANATLGAINPKKLFSKGWRLKYAILLGQAARAEGDPQKQQTLYKKILKDHPTHTETLLALCQLYFDQRNFRELAEFSRRLKSLLSKKNEMYEAVAFWAEY